MNDVKLKSWYVKKQGEIYSPIVATNLTSLQAKETASLLNEVYNTNDYEPINRRKK